MSKKLFNLADSEYQFWKQFQHAGITYTFDHLDAKLVTFNHPKRNECYKIYFTFSHHVFTKESDGGQYPVYPYSACDHRPFNVERYKLSLNLPEIVQNLPEHFCYHGGYGRYCSCLLYDEHGNEIHYQIVYRAWKERGKMRFHIESAYPLPAFGRAKKVDFWVICHNLLRDKPLPKPAN